MRRSFTGPASQQAPIYFYVGIDVAYHETYHRTGAIKKTKLLKVCFTLIGNNHWSARKKINFNILKTVRDIKKKFSDHAEHS